MLKRTGKLLLAGILSIGFLFYGQGKASAETDDVINEKLGVPIVVYGETLTAEQKEETRKLLKVDNPQNVDEITVTAQDLARLINGNPNSRMFSSAKITLKEKGNGLVVTIVTPGNITEVTNQMYANALLTAGVENANVDVASPVKVTGHSALVGIYKAYESKGEVLDKDRMEVANEELELATELADKEGMSDEKVTELLTEIKKMIAEQNPATREDVEQIVQEQLNKMNIELSEQDRQLLIDLFDKMRSLDIDFGHVKQQLEDISKDIKGKLEKVVGDEGFWDSVSNFFQKLIDSIRDLFK
ncbi:Extracellular protein [Bacillus freudenreichii]|nr:Extracellular protein [Bacillus freudenreichii]